MNQAPNESFREYETNMEGEARNKIKQVEDIRGYFLVYTN